MFFTLCLSSPSLSNVDWLIDFCHSGNEYIQSAKPWELLASDPLECGLCVHFAVNLLRYVCALLQPFMPAFTGMCGSMMENNAAISVLR
jgi:methionyl-tRNA synthetase